MALEVDPFGIFIKFFGIQNPYRLTSCLGFVIQQTFMIQYSRILSLSLLLLVFTMYEMVAIMKYIQHFPKTSKLSHLEFSHKIHNCASIILHHIHNIHSIGISGTIFFSALFAVAGNFSIIGLRSKISYPLFSFFLIISIVIFLVFATMLPIYIAVYEQSEIVGWRWKAALFLFSNNKRKIWRRKIWARDNVKVVSGVGNFDLFVVKKETRMTFLATVLEYTATTLLSFQPKK